MELEALVREGDANAIKRLAASASKPELKKALGLAVKLGNSSAAKAFADAGAVVDAEWIYDAVRRHDAPAVAAAIAAGADPARPAAGYFHPPVVDAVERGRGQCVEVMLDHGVSPNLATASGEPLLHVAIRRERLNGRKSLFANELARRRGQAEDGPPDGSFIVDLLVRRGADLARVGGYGPALKVAVTELGEDSDRVRVLRRLGAPDGVLGWKLGRAVYDGDDAALESLLADAPASELAEPLEWAVRMGKRELAERLVKLGADANAPHSAMLCAVTQSSRLRPGQKLELVKWLVSQGVNPNQRDYKDETPIELAQEFALHDVVAALKDAGAVMPRRGDLSKARGCAEPGGNEESLCVLGTAGDVASAIAAAFGGRVVENVYRTHQLPRPAAAVVVRLKGHPWSHVFPLFSSFFFAEALGKAVTLDVLLYGYGKVAEAYEYTLWRGGSVAESYEHFDGQVKFTSTLGTKPPTNRANPIRVIDKAFKRMDAWAIETGPTAWPAAAAGAVIDLAGVEPQDVEEACLVEGMDNSKWRKQGFTE